MLPRGRMKREPYVFKALSYQSVTNNHTEGSKINSIGSGATCHYLAYYGQ